MSSNRAPRRSVSFDDWGAVNQVEARRLARDPSISPLYLRLLLASIAQVNLAGHAEFAPGELAAILSSAPSSSGDRRTPSRQQINTAVRRLISMRLLAEGSGIRCLLPNEHLVEKAGGRGGGHCGYHGQVRRR